MSEKTKEPKAGARDRVSESPDSGVVDWKPEIRSRLAGLKLDPAREADIVEELSRHLDDRFAELRAGGATEAEATRLVLEDLGADGFDTGEPRQVERPEPRALGETKGNMFDELTANLKHGARMLLKNPGFTAVAVVTLALGIGANTAVFSLVNAILLRSLPAPNPRELRVVAWCGTEVHNTRNSGNRITDLTGRVTQDAFSYPLFLALREQCSSQCELFGYALARGVTARSGAEPVSSEGLLVSDNFFSGLGVRPLIGRVLGPEDETAANGQALVISHRWWEQQFGRDPGVVGRPIALNGFEFTIVGVLPAEFSGVRSGGGEDFYASFSAQPELLPREARTAPERWWVPLMARVKPGVTDAQLQAGLSVAFARGAEDFMKQPKVLVSAGRAGPDWGRRAYTGPLFLLMGVVTLVLLVACANVAGLLLARSAVRQNEFAIRAALGARRWRLVRQSVTESAILAFAGGGLGVLIAYWGKAGISRFLAASPDALQCDTSLDFGVLAFNLAVSVATALLSGVLPALRSAQVDPRAGLKDRATLGGPRLRFGRALVVGQIALSMLLSAGAGLYIQTLVNLKRVNPGFATENLLLFQVNPGNAGYNEPRAAAFYGSVQDSLAAMPGVATASLIRYPLLTGNGSGTPVSLPGVAPDRASEYEAQTLTVGESFFKTLGIQLQLGRELRPSDSADAPKVTVVNEAFVRKYLAGLNPIGLTMKADGADWRIAGVCRDTKFAEIKAEAPPTAYLSFRQKPTGSAYFALRVTAPPLAVAAEARKALAAIDPNIPLTEISTQEEVRDKTIYQERMLATLCGSLAALSILLSCNGLYGLMAYHVSRRAGEMGLRLALGATRRQIAGPILKEAVILAGAGVMAGIPLTLALTRIIRGHFYGVGPADPAIFSASVILLVIVALLAAWIPARRAAKVDPMVALRSE
jgi:predicted permease